jgi:hypothetical protein
MILFDSIVNLNIKYICDIPILSPNFTNLRASHKSLQQFYGEVDESLSASLMSIFFEHPYNFWIIRLAILADFS